MARTTQPTIAQAIGNYRRAARLSYYALAVELVRRRSLLWLECRAAVLRARLARLDARIARLKERG